MSMRQCTELVRMMIPNTYITPRQPVQAKYRDHDFDLKTRFILASCASIKFLIIPSLILIKYIYML